MDTNTTTEINGQEPKNNIIEKRKNKNKYRVYNQIINSFYDDMKINEQESQIIKPKQLIKIVPEIIYNTQNKNIKVEFKIGNTELYRIKNLIKFYENVASENIVKYAPKLEFQHVKENFEPSDWDLLEFILKYAEMLKLANEGIKNYEYLNQNLNASSIIVSNSCLDDLFDVLVGKKVGFNNNYKQEKLYFSEEQPKIKFCLEEHNDEEYKLMLKPELDDLMIFEGKKYLYLLRHNKIFRCEKEIKNTIVKLIKLFKENYTNEIVFQKKDSPKFFSVVMPAIKENLDIKAISKSEIEKYVPAELYVKLFLDYDKNNYITADIKFCYKDIEFNPLIQFENKELSRDLAKENRVMDMFVKSGFMLDQVNNRLILVNEQKIYEFLSEQIEEYMQKFEVLATENFRKKEVSHLQVGSVGVRLENNLLKINLEGLKIDAKELEKLMEAYKLKKKYFRLKDGSFISLKENETLKFLEDLSVDNNSLYSQIDKYEITMPAYRSLYLEKILEKLDSTVEKDEKYESIVKNINEKRLDGNIEIPNDLNAELRKYQIVGFQWMKNIEKYMFGGILADDMGLGKTLQMITLLLSYVKQSNVRKSSLVVCPSSLVLNWENEIKRFAPQIKSLIITGNSNERKKKINKIEDYDVVITSYDLLKRDIEDYEDLNYEFKYVIADEAQYIKNNNTQNFKAIKKIKGETRYALTGTPIENSLSELWSIFDFIMPGYLFTNRKFKEIYEVPIIKDEDRQKIERLKMLISPFVLRRIKEDVLTELPDKTITILNNEMEEEQFKIYMSYLAQAKEEIAQEINMRGFEGSQMKILAVLMRLRQICCHPSLFIENYKGESSKLNQCMEILKDAIQSGHKILLFSGYTSMFNLIEKELKKDDIKYYKLTGKTNVGERIKLVEDFNKNEEIKVFLISLKAGGTGLNLIGADTVIHYDPWWNLSTENQATDRTYRIGQKKNVQVYKLITKNSIEEKISELQQKKARLIDNMLSTKETFISKLTKEEIMELFK